MLMYLHTYSEYKFSFKYPIGLSFDEAALLNFFCNTCPHSDPKYLLNELWLLILYKIHCVP